MKCKICEEKPDYCEYELRLNFCGHYPEGTVVTWWQNQSEEPPVFRLGTIKGHDSATDSYIVELAGNRLKVKVPYGDLWLVKTFSVDHLSILSKDGTETIPIIG